MTANRIYTILCGILFGFTFILFGCSPTSVDDVENGGENTKEKQSEAGIADDGLILSFIEEMGDSFPELSMKMQTVRMMPCSNYFIRMNLEDEFAGDVLTRYLRLTEIDRANACFTALGPAVARVPFDDLEGDVGVIIEDGEFADKIQIFISDEKVENSLKRD